MKNIRWGGLIGFIIITAAIAGSFLLFAEPLARSFLQTQLSQLNKAKVDIQAVDIGYSPFSLTITNLQATDASQPMSNMFEVAQVKFSLSLSDLIYKKFIVDDMSLSGIKLNTPRKTSGTIETPKKEKDQKDLLNSLDLPKIALPDIDDILSKEPLTSEKLISELNLDIQNTQKNWQLINQDINDSNRWAQYENLYNTIQKDLKGNFSQKLQAVKSAKKLSKSLKAEAKKIKQARKTINTDISRLNDNFKAAKESPKEDIKRIKEKYSLNNLNAGNITQLLFGNKAAEWVRLAQTTYDRIKPYIGDDDKADEEQQEAPARAGGKNIVFKEYNPKPGFYIRNISVDAITERGRFAGIISDVSSNQSINKQATRFKLSGKDLKHSDMEVIKGELNYIKKTKGFSELVYSITRHQLNDYPISKSSSLPIAIKKSLMDVATKVRLQNGVLAGSSRLNFNDVDFSTKNADKGNNFSRMLANSLEQVQQFYLDIKFSGAIENPKLKINSDLDKKIGTQLKAQLNKRKLAFEKNLKSKIENKIKEPMKKLETELQQLNKIKSKLNAKEKELQTRIASLKKQIRF